jgi:hypothetical protein
VAFAAVQLGLVAVVAAADPWPVAVDVLWPAYQLQGYATLVGADIRWLWWGGWRLLVGQYLLPFSAGLLGAASLW